MILPGRLRATTLGDVLGTLHRARVWGRLELIGRDPPYHGRRHEISIQEGLVTNVQTTMPTPPIGEVLREAGQLTAHQHAGFLRALRSQPYAGMLAGELLIHFEYVAPKTLMSGLNLQNRLRLDAVFSLRDADVRFHPLARCMRDVSGLTPSEFLYGRPRARDAGRPCLQREQGLDRALAVLGLAPGATRQQVRRAFRCLASAVHPDLHVNADVRTKLALEARFAELSQAYHVIITRAH